MWFKHPTVYVTQKLRHVNESRVLNLKELDWVWLQNIH